MATASEKRAVVLAVRAAGNAGIREEAACGIHGVSRATFRRWAARLDAGLPLDDGKSSGRPSLAAGMTQEEADELRRRYVKSNLREGAGSMTYAARSAARDPNSCLSDATRAAILKTRSSKHKLPVAVRRAVRAADAAVRFYRSPDEVRLHGVSTRGYLRMALDEQTGDLRRLVAGERQSWDDASINFPVVVPWPWGGDKCSDRWGCRVARFQLLIGIDDATDHCVGWSYVCRMQDGYRAEDVVRTVAHAWSTGYVPDSVVFEGGAWQADRTLRFLDAAAVRLISAKGRPRQKLIENYLGRLWTPLSEFGGPSIGRYRGEMKRETDELMRCQRGALDPRRAFAGLEQALDAIQKGIDYLEAEQVESGEYGIWVPAQAHAEQIAAKPDIRTLPAGIGYLAAPEVHLRSIRRGGLVAARAQSPLGVARTYVFATTAAQFEGARVRCWFDPHTAPVSATLELAEAWRDTPAGTIIDRQALAVNAAPEVIRDEAAGRWCIRFDGGVDAAALARRASVAAVRRELRGVGLDGRRIAGVSEVRAAGQVAQEAGLVPAASLPVARAPELDDPTPDEIEELERVAGLVAGVA